MENGSIVDLATKTLIFHSRVAILVYQNVYIILYYITLLHVILLLSLLLLLL